MTVSHYYVQGGADLDDLPAVVYLAAQMDADYACAPTLAKARKLASEMVANGYTSVVIGKVHYDSAALCRFWGDSFNGQVKAVVTWIEGVDA